MAEILQTTPHGCGVSSCALASTPVDASTAVETWGGWVLASDLDAEKLVADMRWAVQGLIPMDAVALLYGANYTGKSTLAGHLGHCFVSAADFFGHRVEGMPCFYLALENVKTIREQTLAYQRTQGAGWIWPRPFALSDRTVDLGRESDANAIAEDIRKMSDGGPAALIIDALLDGIGDRDIVSNYDMGPVMRHCHDIVASIGGPVILVHHANRSLEKGVLGASVILTRSDVHLRVEEAKGGSNWQAEKVKGGTKLGWQGFSFRDIPLGTNVAGQPVSSCVILEADGALEPLPSSFATAKRRPSASGTRKKTTSEGSTPERPSSAPAKRPAGHATKSGGGWASLRTARR
ncbi:MAG: AAA family ATPase [Desulfovibrio sp.]|nr:AAA family ATPase [Desulfovibrio sp.]